MPDPQKQRQFGSSCLTYSGILALVLIVVIGILFVSQLTPGARRGSGLTESDSTSVAPVDLGELTNEDAATAEDIVRILKEKSPNSPLINFAQSFIDSAHKFHVNPLYMLAVTQHESGFGKEGNAAKICNNPAGMRYAKHHYSSSGVTAGRCTAKRATGFASFDNFGDGVMAMGWHLNDRYFQQMDAVQKYLANWLSCNVPSSWKPHCPDFIATVNKYVSQGKLTTTDPILAVVTQYTPPTENDPATYAVNLKKTFSEMQEIANQK